MKLTHAAKLTLSSENQDCVGTATVRMPAAWEWDRGSSVSRGLASMTAYCSDRTRYKVTEADWTIEKMVAIVYSPVIHHKSFEQKPLTVNGLSGLVITYSANHREFVNFDAIDGTKLVSISETLPESSSADLKAEARAIEQSARIQIEG